MALYGITKARTCAMSPRSNGKVETFTRTLKKHLKMLVQKNQKDWPRYLPIISQVYRSLPTSSTKYLPYEILFGDCMRMSVDLARGEPPNHPPCFQSNKKYQDHPLALRQHLWNIHKEVRQNIHFSARRMKDNHDRTANYTPFEVGQKVWLFTPTRIKGQSPKLMAQWSGLWEILSILNDCVVRMKSLKTSKIQIVNIDRLALYHCTEG